jgi:hypothetical protein
MIFKLFKLIAFGVVILLIAAFYMVFFAQKIDPSYLPPQLQYCGKTLRPNDSTYQELASWLAKNQQGWGMSFAKLESENEAKSPIRFQSSAFWVEIEVDRVIVSYKTDCGFPQFIKYTSHSLPTKC